MKKLIFITSILFIFITLNQAFAWPGWLRSSTENMLIGSWESSIYISPGKMAKMSNEPMNKGDSMEMTASCSQTYHVGGKYNGDGEFTIRLRQGEQEIRLSFLVRDAGTWKMHDNILVETTENAVVTPMDEITKRVVKQIPELQTIVTMITPIRGESMSSKIIHISETTAEVKMMEPPYASFTLRKKVNK